ncbi:MAG TPA: hypothetical protein VGG24_02525, partial [Paraburkholderia sp.]
EWKHAVNDPDTRRRFRHFVNSDARDELVTFVEERGQIRPATPDERDASASRGDAADVTTTTLAEVD